MPNIAKAIQILNETKVFPNLPFRVLEQINEALRVLRGEPLPIRSVRINGVPITTARSLAEVPEAVRDYAVERYSSRFFDGEFGPAENKRERALEKLFAAFMIPVRNTAVPNDYKPQFSSYLTDLQPISIEFPPIIETPDTFEIYAQPDFDKECEDA